MLRNTSYNVQLASALDELSAKDSGGLTGLLDELESNGRIPLAFFDKEFLVSYCLNLEKFVQRFRNEMQMYKSGEQPIGKCAPTEVVQGGKFPQSSAKATNSRGYGKALETSRSEKAKIMDRKAKWKPRKSEEKSTSIHKECKMTESRGNTNVLNRDIEGFKSIKSSGKSNTHLKVHTDKTRSKKCRYCATKHTL